MRIKKNGKQCEGKQAGNSQENRHIPGHEYVCRLITVYAFCVTFHITTLHLVHCPHSSPINAMHLGDGGDYNLEDGHCQSRPDMDLIAAEMLITLYILVYFKSCDLNLNVKF